MKQICFVSVALGGPEKYTYLDMTKAHEGMNIQNFHFDLIVKYLGIALKRHGMNKEELAIVKKKLEPLRKPICYK